MPRLDFYLNYELQATINLEAPELKIGRDPSSAICLPDKRISRVHAVIRSRDEVHEIENRGASGTKINGVLIEEPGQLRPGDAIFIAHYILIYQSDDVPAADHASTVLIK